MSHAKIAVYPASFNPIHQGHLSIAEKALQSGFDGIIFLVCCPDENLATQRAMGVKEAIGDDPRLGIETWSGLLPHFVDMKQKMQ